MMNVSLVKNNSLTYLSIGCLGMLGFIAGFSVYNFNHQQLPPQPPSPLLVIKKDDCPSDLHYSYFSSKSFFDDAYKNAPTPNIIAAPVKGVIVNHHLLAPNLIAETIGTIATSIPMTVVLISPNHFHAGNGQIIASIDKWDTPYGILESNCEVVSELQKQGVLNIDESPFVKEHGVTGIVSFIKKSLPNARVVPIIVKDTLSEDALNNFVQVLYTTLGDKGLVIGSFDFSHYLPSAAAQFHDDKSLSVLKNFDYQGLQTLDIDSKPGLEVVLRYLEKMGARQFSPMAHSNSAEVLHDPSISETTSYIDGAFSVGPGKSDSTATVLAFGDMMLDRNVRKKIQEQGANYPFDKIRRFLGGSDVVVANAEGPFTSEKSVTLNKVNGPLVFTFDTTLPSELRKFGFTLLSQANNHTLNFGQAGLKQSEQVMTAAGLGWFGDPLNQDVHPYTTTVRGAKIAFIGFNQFAPSGASRVIEAVRAAKQGGAFTIVYTHWGIEYNLGTSVTQVKLAHEFIDAGADVVLGSHPHVIEPVEVYKGKAIFYSLGNFIFDQAVNGPTGQGLSVGLTLNKTDVTYYLFPFGVRDQQATLMNYPESVRLLGVLAEKSTVTAKLKAAIKGGVINLPRL